MIISDIYAGLGNQMFQYAFARALQEKTGERLLLNGYSAVRTNDIRHFSLSPFNLPKCVECPDIKTQRFWDLYSKIKRRIITKNNANLLYGEDNLNKMIKKGMYITRDLYEYYDLPVSKKKLKYIIGFWQNAKYFESISDKIRSELKVAVPPSKENEKMLEKISGCNAVCVHIRLGDYLLEQNKALNICTEDYYIKGMDYISENTQNPTFFVFSYSHDDIEYIKNNYHFEKFNPVYVDLSNPDYEELRLMYSCNHFIIANSTFSFWAQYLGEYEEKIVVAPKEWNREKHQDDSGIFMDNWHLIEV